MAGISFVPVVLAAREWRRRLLRGWSGPPAWLVDALTTVVALVLVSELLGTISLFSVAPMTVAFAIGGSVALWLARRAGADHPTVEPIVEPPARTRRTPRQRSWPGAVALMATGVLAADWGTRTVAAVHHGITNTDSLWYHLPFAARFVQDGSITSLHYVDTDPVTVYFPASSELLHALAMMFLGNDLLSVFMNLGWLAVALLAAWCVGRPYGVAPVTMTAAVALLATPGLAATQAGGAYTDVVGLALFLSSIALLVNARRDDGSYQTWALAAGAAAAGLALGTKYTLVAPVVLLTIAVWIAARRGLRMREAGLWTLLVLLSGSFWYGRNLVAAGNPIPSFHLRLGPLRLPSPPTTTPSSTVASSLFDGRIWRHFYLPGMHHSLGPAWWALLAFSFAGMVAACGWGRNSLERLLGIVAAGSVVAFVFTPQFLGSPGPIYFVYNFRYAAPGLLLGLVALPLVPAVAETRWAWILVGGLGAMVGVTQLDPTLWPNGSPSPFPNSPVHGSDAVLGAVVGLAVLVAGAAMMALRRIRSSMPPRRSPSIAAAAVVVLVVLGCGYGLEQLYLGNRYTDASDPALVAPQVFAWAQHVHDTRIAVVGQFLVQQYPLYGRDLSNYVQYVERRAPNGGLSPYPDCEDWRRALHNGRFDYLISVSGPESTWTDSDPTARLVRVESIAGHPILAEFRLGSRLDLTGCTGAPDPRV